VSGPSDTRTPQDAHASSSPWRQHPIVATLPWNRQTRRADRKAPARSICITASPPRHPGVDKARGVRQNAPHLSPTKIVFFDAASKSLPARTFPKVCNPFRHHPPNPAPLPRKQHQAADPMTFFGPCNRRPAPARPRAASLHQSRGILRPAINAPIPLGPPTYAPRRQCGMDADSDRQAQDRKSLPAPAPHRATRMAGDAPNETARRTECSGCSTPFRCWPAARATQRPPPARSTVQAARSIHVTIAIHGHLVCLRAKRRCRTASVNAARRSPR